MAEIVFSMVIQELGKIIGNQMLKEGSRLFRFKEDIVWIETQMGYIRSYLKDAEEKQWRSQRVRELIKNIWDLAYDVEDIINTYFTKLPPSGGNARERCLSCLKSAKSIHDFAKEIEEIKKKVEDIKSARQAYGIEETSGCDGGDNTYDLRRSLPHVDDVNVVGFDESIKELVAIVLHEDLHNRVISITGMAGLGKTTLAKKIYNSVRQEFDCSAWIYVSQQPNMKELLQDVARQVGLEEEKSRDNVEVNLTEFLSQKRYVIVIDDIWNIEPWNALKNGIPTNSWKGSRIIITSRKNEVVRDIGAQVGGKTFPTELEPLNRKNSRKLFKRSMPAQQNNYESRDPPQLKNIGKQILDRCGGVPLAIVVTAGLLSARGRTIDEWNEVFDNMGQIDKDNMGQLAKDRYSNIFVLSYKDLPVELKPCFLYFSLFPEDYEIASFELINLWAAEGFIRGSEAREVEDVGNNYLNHLITRNLIQVVKRRFNGKVRSCCIHDILRYHCIQIAKDINFFNTHNDVTGQRVRRVTTHGSNFDDYVSSNYQTPKLRAMLSFGGQCDELRRNQVKAFFGGFKFLHVLCVKLRSFCFLPFEIGNLYHLSYLGISANYASVELPCTISKLKSLWTLDLGGCSHVFLPCVIWNMNQLRHILLPISCSASSFRGVNLDRFHPNKISSPNLCTLSVYEAGDMFKVEWLHRFTNLKTLRVHRSPDRIIEVLSDATPISLRLEELQISHGDDSWKPEKIRTLNLSQYDNLHNLRMKLGDIEELPQHDKFPPNLTKLTLEDTTIQRDPMETLKKLPKLKILKLSAFSYQGKQMVCSGECGNFPQLEVLKIKIADLELMVEEGGMPELKELTVIYCNPILRLPERIEKIKKIIMVNPMSNYYYAAAVDAATEFCAII